MADAGVSLSAIAITAFLALKNQTAAMGLREQARLLDLAHDTIFVRDMRDVITYWNRAAEELHGWPREQALGKPCHELLRPLRPAVDHAGGARRLGTARGGGR